MTGLEIKEQRKRIEEEMEALLDLINFGVLQHQMVELQNELVALQALCEHNTVYEGVCVFCKKTIANRR